MSRHNVTRALPTLRLWRAAVVFCALLALLPAFEAAFDCKNVHVSYSDEIVDLRGAGSLLPGNLDMAAVHHDNMEIRHVVTFDLCEDLKDTNPVINGASMVMKSTIFKDGSKTPSFAFSTVLLKSEDTRRVYSVVPITNGYGYLLTFNSSLNGVMLPLPMNRNLTVSLSILCKYKAEFKLELVRADTQVFDMQMTLDCEKNKIPVISTPSSGASKFAIFLFTMLGLFTLYMFVMFLYRRRVLGERGVDQIPHYHTFVAIPSQVSGLFNRIRGRTFQAPSTESAGYVRI